MKHNIELNIVACCNEKYADFIPLFIISNLFHVSNSFVEIGTDNIDLPELKKSLDILNHVYPNRFLVRKMNFDDSVHPNAVRFLMEPTNISEYVYISDIDIITLQSNIVDMHKTIMDKYNLPYSNIVRAHYINGVPIANVHKRLTGLHFTPYENYYPIENWDDLTHYLKLNDEMFLFQLMLKRFPTLENGCTERPVHGMHISPNREPHGMNNEDGIRVSPGWGIEKGWKPAWTALRYSEEFKSLYDNFSERIKQSINIIDEFMES
jgi:hypothetical protein